MSTRHRHAMRFRSPLLAMTVIGLFVSACHSGRRDPRSMTSTELVAAGERDTVFVRRVRMFEEIAARIPTDSLARLYVATIDGPAERSTIYVTYGNAIACQVMRMIWQFGSVASAKAIRRMEDSLFTTPAARERWSDAQLRLPDFGSSSQCNTSDRIRGPDSLDVAPRRMIRP
jgi:hypothetical protein